MKKHFLFLTAFVLILNLGSCSKDNSVTKNVMKEIKVTATLKNLSSNKFTRAVYNPWESGDEIGLFMKNINSKLSKDVLAYNIKYTSAGSTEFRNSSKSKVYFPFNKEKVDFISYYPYTQLLNGLFYEIDVANQTDFSNIQLMYSDNAIGANSTIETVNLEFEHQLSKVIIIIDIGATRKDPTDLSVKITNVKTEALFSLANGLISDKKGVDDVYFNVDSINIKGQVIAQAILLPDDDLTDNTLVVTINDTSYLYDLGKPTSYKSFRKSSLYTFMGPFKDESETITEGWIAIDTENAGRRGYLSVPLGTVKQPE